MMLYYLQNNLFALFNQERSGGTNALTSPPTIVYEDTCTQLFDIADPKGKPDATYVANVGNGQATYHNNSPLNLRIINYEAFVNLFTIAGIDKRGRSRIDFIVYDTSNDKRYFILNELSEGARNNKLSKARLQLQNTLHVLMKNIDTRNYIASFNKKQCIFSCRTEPAPSSPLNMADGFITASLIIPANFTFSAKSIERLGFECIENDHIQVM